VVRHALLAILGALALLGAAPAPHAAEAAADVTPTTLDLTPWRGRVVLVDFWASWCGPCRESFPWMDEMLRRYRDRGLEIVAVNLDEDRGAAERFLEGRGSGFHVVYDPDGRIAADYDIRSMPASVLFDRQGRPAFAHSGFRPADAAAYERDLVALLDGAVAGRAVLPRELVSESPTAGKVRAWERGVLARRDMALDCDPLDIAFDEHIHFSKEASSGGRGFGGGGCGCN